MSRAYKFRNPDATYFVTCTVVHWVDVFTRKVNRDIVLESLRFCIKNKGLELFAWCIMSNHIHLMVRASGDHRMENIMRDFKKFTSKQIVDRIEKNEKERRSWWMLEIFRACGLLNSNNTHFQFWQQHNHPIELFNSRITDQKLNYIHNNPVAAGIVDAPEYYNFSSAKDYVGQRGLIDIQFID